MSRKLVNTICRTFPGAEVSDPWGGGHDAWKVRGKMFACIGAVIFLAVKQNQPEDDGEYGVPDVALPISHRQLPACQSARPLIRGGGPRGERCPADVIRAANKTGHSQIQNGPRGMEMGQHQMRHEGRQLRRWVDQTIWRLLKLLKPNAFSARRHSSSGSRSPSRVTSMIRFAMISRTRSACPMS
jgi:hypothetical protein